MTNETAGKCTHCAGYGYRRDFEYNTCAEFDPNGACAAGKQACPHHACYWCAGRGTADAPTEQETAQTTAETMRRATGSVAVTVTHESRGADGALVTTARATSGDVSSAEIALMVRLDPTEYVPLSPEQLQALARDVEDMRTAENITRLAAVELLNSRCKPADGARGYMSRYAEALISSQERADLANVTTAPVFVVTFEADSPDGNGEIALLTARKIGSYREHAHYGDASPMVSVSAVNRRGALVPCEVTTTASAYDSDDYAQVRGAVRTVRTGKVLGTFAYRVDGRA